MTMSNTGRTLHQHLFALFSRWGCLLLVASLVGSSLAVRVLQAQDLHIDRNPDREDWSVLSAKGLGLQPSAPMSGGTVERPEFTCELVRLQWRQGDPVDIYVSLPRGVKKPHVILYLYGYPTDTSRFRNDLWSKGAVEGGFAAVGMVSALTGERYHSRPMKEWFVSELQESLAKSTHDVQMVLDYLEQRGDLNTDRVGIYAQGSGASIAILAASVDSRIAALDLLNPWGDWSDWLKQSALVPENERSAYLQPEFLEKVAAFDPVQVLPKLNERSVRLQQVGDDPVTPKAAGKRLAAAVPRGAQVLQSENWAAYRKTWQEKKLWSWAKEQLGQLPSPASLQRAEPVAAGGRPE
ncbi:conserved exported hypothetical protein [Acidobacteriia bacterium SbA2]|nr:conserved exported hypothetical protein [Acidobacteriia bacterium SbA2]